RNVAVAMGNALRAAEDEAQKQELIRALQLRAAHEDAVVREHVAWALAQARD
ncbi:MAG: tRNA epoxyqueuosine(34) reductase QueG, partial [Comamonas sp.]|nr:tRNA epoxyqueuosine(34) reductase QueG [Comamonas sp.]